MLRRFLKHRIRPTKFWHTSQKLDWNLVQKLQFLMNGPQKKPKRKIFNLCFFIQLHLYALSITFEKMFLCMHYRFQVNAVKRLHVIFPSKYEIFKLFNIFFFKWKLFLVVLFINEEKYFFFFFLYSDVLTFSTYMTNPSVLMMALDFLPWRIKIMDQSMVFILQMVPRIPQEISALLEVHELVM